MKEKGIISRLNHIDILRYSKELYKCYIFGAQKGAIEDLFGNWSLLRVFEKQKVHKQGRKEPRNNVSGITQSAESKVELVKYISGNWCMFESRIALSQL